MSIPTSVGSTVLLSAGAPGKGWEPAALLLSTPLIFLRYRDGVCRVYPAGALADKNPFLVREGDPLELLSELMSAMKVHLPKAGPGAGKPSFPMATVAAAYEFGRTFPPHQDCFANALPPGDDDFFASIFIDGYRPDSTGGTERIGYAGVIPEGWYPGAPALSSGPSGHTPPALVPHALPEGNEADVLPQACVTREQHRTALGKIQEYLAAGDIYQANYTVLMEGRTSRAPEQLFDVALKRGGAAYGATMILPTGTVLCFSPELYLRRRGTQIETRPIKGTRQAPDRISDVETVRQQLEQSPKDRAEHIMIVDLERSDLGRLCLPGSITVDPLMEVVEHPTVLHMESTVKGALRPDVTLGELFAATFPGGSVTGAPKRRALEILSELEQHPRGIYCGALGWVDVDGDCELCLPIRTALIRPDGKVQYHAGGGIVADSDVDMEWQELEDKARFFKGLFEGKG